MGQRNVRRAYMERTVDVREPKERFLIVCEGEKTEPNYFKSFRVPRDVIVIRGIGDNTRRIVEYAIGEIETEDYDQVWCVFDRDSFPAGSFNAAFELARENSIKIAYSNEAFELWYLLHFHYYNTGMSRSDYGARLSELLGHKYEKNSPTVYAEIESRQHTAIKNANRLLMTHTPLNPESNNPSTTVHLLVLQLNRFIEL
jgi:hypothetical protein